MVRYPDDPAVVQLAKPILAAAEKKLHRVELSCGTPCKIVTDKKLSPWPDTSEAVLFFEPGPHEIAVTWGRKSRQANVEATAGGKSSLRLEAPAEVPTAPASASASAPPPSGDERGEPSTPAPGFELPRPVAIGGAVATVVLAGVSVWSAFDMRDNPGKEKVRVDCAGQPRTCITYQEALSAQRRTNVLVGVTAGVAVATGVVAVFLTDWAGRPPPPAAARGVRRVVPYLTTDGRFPILGATGTF